ncbi:hypothetical protein P8C59_005576 [Phyllachora maydis]|uniref:Uncharacterized protein n=1 Tax=Phyllachora maydis TaxID=1825666 RepID=A0AAD9I6A0_9PEZI|nr:hypothetical protein P8C59_005576 [Phyllachora maydis]
MRLGVQSRALEAILIAAQKVVHWNTWLGLEVNMQYKRPCMDDRHLQDHNVVRSNSAKQRLIRKKQYIRVGEGQTRMVLNNVEARECVRKRDYQGLSGEPHPPLPPLRSSGGTRRAGFPYIRHMNRARVIILASFSFASGLDTPLLHLLICQTPQQVVAAVRGRLRIMRACHPNFGWHPAVGGIFKGVFVTVGASLVMVIAATVQSFYTMDVETRETDRNIQLFVATYLTILAGLPVPIALLSTVLPRSTLVEKFGQGTWRGKIGLLVFTSTLLTVGAAFRAAVAYNARPINAPAWFDSKACFYCFNFLIELIVVYTYALFRFDRRFWVPDGSAEPGHYISGNKGRQSQMHRAMYQGAGAAYTQSSFTLAGKRTSMYPASVYTFTTDKAVDRHSSLYAAKGPRALSMYSSYNDSEAASSRHDQEWMERAMMELYGRQPLKLHAYVTTPAGNGGGERDGTDFVQAMQTVNARLYEPELQTVHPLFPSFSFPAPCCFFAAFSITSPVCITKHEQ